jgi:hypothetical protein
MPNYGLLRRICLTMNSHPLSNTYWAKVWGPPDISYRLRFYLPLLGPVKLMLRPVGMEVGLNQGE